jgi:hypothetical protein
MVGFVEGDFGQKTRVVTLRLRSYSSPKSVRARGAEPAYSCSVTVLSFGKEMLNFARILRAAAPNPCH